MSCARAALSAGDAGRLAAMLPRRERWRLYGAFAADAGYLDIETDGGETVTAVGVLDRDGPRLFLRGRDLDDFPAATRAWRMVVTFNGASFDLPVLRRAFPSWRPPLAHVDLRQLWWRLGHQGGLKRLERETGLGRPPHLDGLSGLDAVRLWHRHLAGDRQALRLLAEYNLYDAVNLRTLMRMWDSMRDPGMAGIARLVHSELHEFPELARFYFAEVILRARRMITSVLDRGIASGEFRGDLHPFSARGLPHLMVFSARAQCFFATMDPERLADGQVLDGILDLFLHGVEARPHAGPAV